MRKVLREIRYCKCGCGRFFLCRNLDSKRYVPQHHLLKLCRDNAGRMNSRTYEELYGIDRAAKLKELRKECAVKCRPLIKYMEKFGVWNKGLTKELDDRVRKYGLKLRGRKLTPKMKIALSTGYDYVCNKLIPNKQETRLGVLLNRLFPEQYVFNYKGKILRLGQKIPDFVNVNGQKKLIELFGNYWHNKEEETERKEFFQRFGWSTLIVWESELRDIDKLMIRLCEFHEVSK